MLERTQCWRVARSDRGNGSFASARIWRTASLARDSPVGLTAASRRASTACAASRKENTRVSAAGRRRGFRGRLLMASSYGPLVRMVKQRSLLGRGPPCPHGAIQLHGGDELVPLRLGERQLGAKEATLRVEDVEVARHAVLVAHVGQLQRPPQGDDLALLRGGPVLGRAQ